METIYSDLTVEGRKNTDSGDISFGVVVDGAFIALAVTHAALVEERIALAREQREQQERQQREQQQREQQHSPGEQPSPPASPPPPPGE